MRLADAGDELLEAWFALTAAARRYAETYGQGLDGDPTEHVASMSALAAAAKAFALVEKGAPKTTPPPVEN
ncbi:MAG TPA: hypothetical protein VK510_03215 [Solirubrobacteraceae bacterium]|nr:hypothetical protein [Solirubrobacteraceae bacterium]